MFHQLIIIAVILVANLLSNTAQAQTDVIVGRWHILHSDKGSLQLAHYKNHLGISWKNKEGNFVHKDYKLVLGMIPVEFYTRIVPEYYEGTEITRHFNLGECPSRKTRKQLAYLKEQLRAEQEAVARFEQERRESIKQYFPNYKE